MADDALSPADELELLRRRDIEADRKRNAKVSALIRSEYRKGKTGTSRLTTPEQIESTRAELKAAGKPSGDRSVAAALHVHESTVRRTLGKIK